ncbi:MAG TPA: phosphoesterase [Alphaproteobacteria bacterium]|nr:phosphoesterase [Alphaproteobacteria bacterium]
MTDTVLDVNGAQLVLRPEGAIWWPERQLLAVADLHFEKGSSYGVRGQFLPPYDTRATIVRLDQLCQELAPRTVVALGDSFHDGNAALRMAPDDRAYLRALTQRCGWIWITGNHDEGLQGVPDLTFVETLQMGPLTFRHDPSEGLAHGEVCGHLHPKAAVTVKGRRISRPSFVSDGRRLVLPAFGAYTGGLDVFDPAFFPVFPLGFQAFLLGRDKVYAFGAGRLRARSAA